MKTNEQITQVDGHTYIALVAKGSQVGRCQPHLRGEGIAVRNEGTFHAHQDISREPAADLRIVGYTHAGGSRPDSVARYLNPDLTPSASMPRAK